MDARQKNMQTLFQSADALFQQNDSDLAFLLLEKARSRFPMQPQGYIRTGFAALQRKNFELAKKMAAQAMEKFPHALDAFVLHAEIAMEQKDFASALIRWERVRTLFPMQPRGYIRAGFAALWSKDFVLAEKFAVQAMEKFPRAFNAFVLHAEISMSQEKFAQALNRWEQVRKIFPMQPQGYIRAGFAALWRKDFVLAEKFAVQAMEKFPRALKAFVLHAEISMSQEKFAQALNRWEQVRKHFPMQPQGYVRAGFAALRLGSFEQAQILSAQAMQKFPNLDSAKALCAELADMVQPVSEKNKAAELSDLLHIAETDMRLGLFRQAFVHFKQAMKGPMRPRAFIGAVEAALKLHKYSDAQKICEDVIAHFPLYFAPYNYLVLSLEAQEKWERALAELENIKHKFPTNTYGWLKRADVLLKSGNYELADAEMKEAVSRFPGDADVFFQFSTLPTHANDSKYWGESIDRSLVLIDKFASIYRAYWQAFTNCIRIERLDYNIDSCHRACHRVLERFLQHIDTKIFVERERERERERESSRPRKLAVYGKHAGILKFFLPVLRCLSPKNIDIVLRNEISSKIIKDFGIEEYTIVYGDEHINEYDYIITDPDFFDYQGKYSCKMIGYSHHGTDNVFRNDSLERLSLAILFSKKQMPESTVICREYISDSFMLPAHADCKCEFCYTGPFHLGEFLEKRHAPKAKLKAELAKELNIDIPEDKPLVFMLEDGYCNTKQMAYAANRMSRYATVVFKPFFLRPGDPILAKFNSNIHIVRGQLAPNLLRFSADFICCGFMSGSFVTSLMLGQNILPYYSRIIQNCNPKAADLEFKRYDDVYRLDYPFLSSQEILFSRFHSEGKLFDLVDAASMEKAILGTEYRDWYQANLSSLQQEVFGDYMLEGSPQKTAEYIMRFVKDGTLGKDCSAIYLKEKYFKA